MKRQRLSLIWAATENRVIGRDGALPWDLPDELAHFHRTTMGKPVIMGRRTYQSRNRPLPGRLNIVLSRQGFAAPGVTVAADLAAALEVAKQDAADECFVIGGSQPYALALPCAERLYATVIHTELPGDTFLPPFDLDAWRLLESRHHPIDRRHPYSYDIEVFERR